MIDKVKESCVACKACAAFCPHSAISFKRNGVGFEYPLINYDFCTNCNLCEQVCPSLNILIENDSQESYAAYSINKPKESSSGGAFYAIAKKIIEKDGCVYGVIFDQDKRIRHTRIDGENDLLRLCGSKYVQSEVSPEIYKSVRRDLKSNRIVLYSGTPCQIHGLKLYLQREYENLFTIDLVCHGVPAPQIFDDYIKFCEKIRFKSVTNFIFRDNRNGWNQNFKSSLIYKDHSQEYNSILSNLWNRIFFSELCTRNSCHSCKYATLQRVGDLSLGDFWGIRKDLANVNAGISLLLCNTDKGRELALDSGLKLREEYTNSINHPNLFRPTKPNKLSIEFQNYYIDNGFKKTIKKYFDFTIWLDLKVRIYNRIMTILKR